MAEVPRIVRERLRSQAVSGEHPDANLLTAFAERTLSDPERAQVLDHLSHCADCREVVALAAIPQVEEEQLEVAFVGPRRATAAASRSWWRSPIVHWSALTAAALVVLIAVGERMRLRREYSASAPAIASYEAVLKPTATPTAPAQPPAQPKESEKVAETARAPRQVETVNRPAVAGASSGRVSGRSAFEAGLAGKPAGAAPIPPAEANNLQSPAASDFSSGSTDGPPLENQRKIDQAQVKALPAPSAAAKSAPGAESSTAVAGGASASPARSQSTTTTEHSAGLARRAFVGPRWSVSPSGAVQRSWDGGRSWQQVPIAEGVNFRAVAVVMAEVWAGGSEGALFHSPDGGAHWTRVQVQAQDSALTGDIVRIELTDGRDLAITTSTGETWNSSDAGATWQRQ